MTVEDAQTQRLRYARQLALPGWGEDGQGRLAAASVLIVGLGGLGAPVATYLAGAGIGALTLNDFDRVDRSNLPRQPLYTVADLGQSKARAAARALAQRNPNVSLRTLEARLEGGALEEAIAAHDAVVDACDNLSTRLAVGGACRRARVPLVSVAAIRREGQIALFPNRGADSACYACLAAGTEALGDCEGQGVLSPLVGVMGSLAALETIQWLLDPTPPPRVALRCFDAARGEWRTLLVSRDARCNVCAHLT